MKNINRVKHLMQLTLMLALSFHSLSALAVRLDPTIINGDVILCPNKQDTLYTQTYDTYQWHKNGSPISGATQPYYVVDYYADAGANFSVYVTQGDQSAMSPSILVDGYVFSPLTVSSYGQGYWFTGDAWEMCKEHELFFEVMSPYTHNVQWFRDGNPIDGATDVVYQVHETGVYSVHGSPSLCPDYVQYSIGLPVIVHQPPIPVITQVEDTLFTSHYPGQWYLGLMPIFGETGEYLIPEQNGWYSFRYTDENGCTSISDSYFYEWDPVGMSKSLAEVVTIQVSKGRLLIENAENIHYQIYSLKGVAVLQGSVRGGVLDIQALPAGLYVLQLQKEGGEIAFKFVKE